VSSAEPDASREADSALTRHPFDLYIVGLGIVSVRQVTREAEGAMRRSNEILYVSDAIGIEGYLHDLCDKVSEV
jgi:hypothetical protein